MVREQTQSEATLLVYVQHTASFCAHLDSKNIKYSKFEGVILPPNSDGGKTCREFRRHELTLKGCDDISKIISGWDPPSDSNKRALFPCPHCPALVRNLQTHLKVCRPFKRKSARIAKAPQKTPAAQLNRASQTSRQRQAGQKSQNTQRSWIDHYVRLKKIAWGFRPGAPSTSSMKSKGKLVTAWKTFVEGGGIETDKRCH